VNLNQLPKSRGTTKRKRVGRGGKRGTFSGHGSKGQKARSGVHPGADFRGGDTPLWKLFPKRRGANKKTPIKHRFFQLRAVKAATLNLEKIERYFADGETVSLETLKAKNLVKNYVKTVKVLGRGQLKKVVKFAPEIQFSKLVTDAMKK